ncbi:MAG: tRNA-specific adenosine deaminase [Acidobacteria bacterium]|nr:MAG: tRNA-specific adenosine deaminase [Acidobacteriota bacterium]
MAEHIDSTKLPYEIQFLRRAIHLSIESVSRGGGPFGALVVRNDGEVIGEGANAVTLECDPTAHAEIVAIRAACRNTGQFHLGNCVIYSSCEPCPMCLAAAYWAQISTIYYAASAAVAADAGFSDVLIYEQLRLPSEERSIALIQIPENDAIQAFQAWTNRAERIEY